MTQSDAPNEGREERTVDELKQLGFKVEFDVESNSWYATRSHNRARLVATSLSSEGLFYEIILHYQALRMHSEKENASLRDQLSKEREARPVVWYSEHEMNDWLRRLNYSKEIADELSAHWAFYLQGAFDKGFDKGKENVREQLEREREMRKELVEGMKNISRNLLIKRNASTINKLEFLIAKASELDKIKT